MQFGKQHFFVIFGIAMIAFIIGPRLIATAKGLPVVGGVLTTVGA